MSRYRWLKLCAVDLRGRRAALAKRVANAKPQAARQNEFWRGLEALEPRVLLDAEGIDFDLFPTMAYSTQDASPTVTVEDDGATLRIVGNGWQKIDLGDRHITPDTILEFDFHSTVQGEIHAIGFDSDEDISNDNTVAFQLYGTQTNWAPSDQTFHDYADTAPDPKHYRIELGQFLTGPVRFLTFVNDHDVAGANAESVFSNIEVRERTTDPIEFDDAPTQPYSTQDASPTVTVEDDGQTLRIVGNGWQRIPLPAYTVTPNTVLAFDFQSSVQGDIHAIGFDNDEDISNAGTVAFQLYGTQTNWAPSDQSFNDYASTAPGTRFYEIPVGRFFTGTIEFMTFINDHDVAGANAQSVFSFVELFEKAEGTLDLPWEAIQPYSTQDGVSQIDVENDQELLRIVGNGWKQLQRDYVVTPHTVLEFMFASSAQGEIHAIGIDSDDDITNANTIAFQLYGTQTNWAQANQDFHDYAVDAPGFKQYRIPLGEFFTGPMQYLTFINDHDVAGATGESVFADVRLFEQPLGAIDFDAFNTGGGAFDDLTDYSTQADNSTVLLEDMGRRVRVIGNGWKRVDLPDYVITEHTVLEFDFQSSSQGEIHAIGFDSDDDITNANTMAFQLYGTQTNWAQSVQDFNDYAAQAPFPQHYRIPVGDFFTGPASFLTLINDHDVPMPGSESVFGNIRLFEDVPLTLPLDNLLAYSSQDETSTIELTNNNRRVRIVGNAWKKMDLGGYPITADTILEFDFQSNTQGEIHAIGFDSDDDITNANTVAFQLYGTQTNWAPSIQDTHDYADVAPDVDHYRIPVGEFFTGDAQFLTFVLDHDVPTPNAEAIFANVRLFEDSSTLFEGLINRTGDQPRAVVVGDVDEDGHPDVVTANRDGNTISVMLGRGDGRLKPAYDLPAGDGPRDIELVDLNNDAHLDVVTANRDANTISVLLGDGDGSFTTPAQFAVGSGPRSVAVGLIDGDAVPDVVTANRDDNTISILSGNGDGTFATATSIAVGGEPRWVALGQVDGDSDVDIVTANSYDGTVSVLLNQGGGTFNRSDVAVGDDPRSVELGHLDDDGNLDIVTANRAANLVTVLPGNGDGTFGAAVHPEAFDVDGTDTEDVVARLGDVDDDGDLDIVAAGYGAYSYYDYGYGDGGLVVWIGHNDMTFDTGVEHEIDDAPRALAVADLNHDNLPELVTASARNDSVSVTVNQGDGRFPDPLARTGQEPENIATGDFNEDMIPDLVTVNDDDETISVLLGRGDGTFGPTMEIAVGAVEPQGVAVGFIDGDTHLDIITSNFGPAADGADDSVAILLGNGDGTFQAPQLIAVDDKPDAVAVGFVDSDAFLDIVTVNSPRVNVEDPPMSTVTVLLGNGDATFHTRNDIAVSPGAEQLVLGFVDDDTDLDIVTSSYIDNGVTVLLGHGDGTFPTRNDVPVGGQALGLALGDLDEDTHTDIIVAKPLQDSVAVLFGDGLGAFATPVDIDAGPEPSDVAVGDVNNDGDLDIVAANYGFYYGFAGQSASVLLGHGDGTFDPRTDYEIGLGEHHLVLEDLNTDGLLDIAVTADLQSRVSVLINQGDGLFPNRVHVTGPIPLQVVTGDVNNDGHLDLISVNDEIATPLDARKSVSVLLGHGDGTFAPAANYTVEHLVESLALGDLNEDGFLDIVTVALDGIASLLVNNQDGTFADPVDFTVGVETESVAIDDANGDGHLDIIAANSPVLDPGNVSVLRGNGDGTFQELLVFTGVGDNPEHVTLGFIDDDDIPDLITVDEDQSMVSVILGCGHGAFETPELFDTGGTGSAALAIGDVDGDGDTDIIVANEDTHHISVLLGDNDGHFSPPTTFATGIGPSSVALGDVNGDGTLDLVTSNSGLIFLDETDLVLEEANSVSLLIGNGDGTFQTQVEFAVGLFPSSVALADLDDDGDLDIVAANAYSSDVTVLLNRLIPDPETPG